jgi:hypothetical protein
MKPGHGSPGWGIRSTFSTVDVAPVQSEDGFSVRNYRSLGPDWSTSVAEAHATCASARPGYIVRLRTDDLNAFPVKLPCRDLSP